MPLTVAVIGGGIFGSTVALEFSKFCETTLFEKQSGIMLGASSSNHLRHHIGFHYPRSKDTVAEIRIASASFEQIFGDCLIRNFPSYYAVAKDQSKITSTQYLDFCNSNKLPFEFCRPPSNIFDATRLQTCVKTFEPVYDIGILKELILFYFQKRPALEIRLNHEVVGVTREKKTNLVTIKSLEEVDQHEYDAVITATYSDFNEFCGWVGTQRKVMLYELVELLEIEIPGATKFGATVIDGDFPSILPRGSGDTYTLGHVKESILGSVVSDRKEREVSMTTKLESRSKMILEESIGYLPILEFAELKSQNCITRVVNAFSDQTDARPTEITKYGNGCYSIFGGKMITAVETARQISEDLRDNLL